MGRQYCSNALGYRDVSPGAQTNDADVVDDGKELNFFAAPIIILNVDGTPALTRGELAERFLEIAERGGAAPLSKPSSAT